VNVLRLSLHPDGMTAVIRTPMDVTVAELAIESFYPADETTAAAFAAGAFSQAC